MKLNTEEQIQNVLADVNEGDTLHYELKNGIEVEMLNNNGRFDFENSRGKTVLGLIYDKAIAIIFENSPRIVRGKTYIR